MSILLCLVTFFLCVTLKKVKVSSFFPNKVNVF